jgi:hypothetical protein
MKWGIGSLVAPPQKRHLMMEKLGETLTVILAYHITAERYMRYGIGTHGHCNIGSK